MTIRAKKKVCQLENILNAALHVFAQHGYDQAKIDDIAEVAQIGKGTVYNYFRTKEELFLSVQQETLKQLFYTMIFEDASKISPTQQLEEALFRIYEFFREQPDRYAIFISTLYSIPKLGGPKSVEAMLSILDILKPKVQEHVKRGNIHPDEANVEDLTMSLFGIASPFLHRWFCSQESYDFTAKIPRIAKIFIYGTMPHVTKK